MVLLKAAPRQAAGYAILEIGAASLRVSLPDELPELDHDPLNDRPTKKQKTGKPEEVAVANGTGVAATSSPADALSSTTAQGATAVAIQGPEKGSTVLEDDELPSVHSTSRTGARVTSSTAATAPADPNEPMHCMPNLIARARAPSTSSSASSASRRIYVGDQLLNECSDYSSLHLRSPIDRGIITDWAAQKVLLDRAISVALANRSLVPRQPMPYTAAVAAKAARNSGLPATHVSFYEIGTDLESRLLEERTVIVTETYFNFPDISAMSDTMLFEQYGAAAIWRTTREFQTVLADTAGSFLLLELKTNFQPHSSFPLPRSSVTPHQRPSRNSRVHHSIPTTLPNCLRLIACSSSTSAIRIRM